MKTSRRPSLRCVLRSLVFAAIAGEGLILAACEPEGICSLPPCPLPMAIRMTVAAVGTPGPVPGAEVEVLSPGSAIFPCASSCGIPGTSAIYTLEVRAPGFRSVRRTVAVAGETPECACPTTRTGSSPSSSSPWPEPSTRPVTTGGS
jgi:hypothetical protein